MLKVGIIGAGAIADRHLEAYIRNPHAQVVAIADINVERAKQKAEKYNVPMYCADYKEILEDKTIDAVSIVTPTFTHSNIAIEALKAGKQVLCEKPPAMNVSETEAMVNAAQETGNLLMFAFVLRFNQPTKLMKEQIDSGNMGDILHADIFRLRRYRIVGGWFMDKAKSGGGPLMDWSIHQIDQAMYLMGYPKVKQVLGFATKANNDLIGRIRGIDGGGDYTSADAAFKNCTIENMATGYVTLDNGASLYVKTGCIAYSVSYGVSMELIGTKGGVKFENEQITMLSNMNDYMVETKPVIENNVNPYDGEVNHFVECCMNHTKCICEGWQAIELMKIIEGIYQSAETGQVVSY